jgi:hypothetical protein
MYEGLPTVSKKTKNLFFVASYLEAVLLAESGGWMEQSADRHKKTEKQCDSEQFQNGLQKTQRGIGGSHIESQDWTKDEGGCLPGVNNSRTNETQPTSTVSK